MSISAVFLTAQVTPKTSLLQVTSNMGLYARCNVISLKAFSKLFAYVIEHLGQCGYSQANMCLEAFLNCRKNSKLPIQSNRLVIYLKRFHAPKYRAVVQDFLTSEPNNPEKLCKYVCLLCMFQGRNLPEFLQAQSSILTSSSLEGAENHLLATTVRTCYMHNLLLPQQLATAIKTAFLHGMWSMNVEELFKIAKNYLLFSYPFDDQDWKTLTTRFEEANKGNLIKRIKVYSMLLWRMLQHAHVYKQPPPSECITDVLCAIDRIINDLNKLPPHTLRKESDLLTVLREYQLFSGASTLTATCKQFLHDRKAMPSLIDKAATLKAPSLIQVRSHLFSYITIFHIL